MTDWQPIETAPRDGTPMLLFYPKADCNTADGIIEGWSFSSPKEIDDGWETIIGSIGEPTHWQPLPPPPTERKDDENLAGLGRDNKVEVIPALIALSEAQARIEELEEELRSWINRESAAVCEMISDKEALISAQARVEQLEEADRQGIVMCDSYAIENQQFHDRFTKAESDLARAREALTELIEANGWHAFQAARLHARAALGKECTHPNWMVYKDKRVCEVCGLERLGGFDHPCCGPSPEGKEIDLCDGPNSGSGISFVTED